MKYDGNGVVMPSKIPLVLVLARCLGVAHAFSDQNRREEFRKLIAVRAKISLGLPDPHCHTGVVSIFDGTPQVCCPFYCKECNDYERCKSVRGQDSENACCKSSVYAMRCGNAPANKCLKACSESVPPCIMDAEAYKPAPAQRHGAADCNRAVFDWRRKAAAALRAKAPNQQTAAARAAKAQPAISGNAIVDIPGVGKIEGISLKHPKVEVFRGIRYAEKPKRFQKPVRAKPFKGVFDAQKHSNVCTQIKSSYYTGKQSEDCLFMYITTCARKDKTKPHTASMPVLFHIHPSAYVMGNAGEVQTDPVNLVGKACDDYGGAVVATPNYRLGALAWLDAAAIPVANRGWYDQRMALEWVRDHISYFGGDPSHVTLMGESAGAHSTLMHMVSPLSAGLFHGAILQSGYQDPFYGNFPRAAVHSFGSDCALSLCNGPMDPQQEYQCLLDVDASTLVKTTACGLNAIPMDGENLVEPMYKSVVQGKTGNIPIIVGSNKYEEDYNMVFYDIKAYLEFLLGFIGFTSHSALYSSYAAYGQVVHGQKMEAVEAMTDFWYTCFARTLAASHPGKAWRYLFDQVAPTEDQQLFNDGLNRSYHTLEIAYIFDNLELNLYAPIKAERNDHATASMMQGHWINFVTNKKPKASWPQGNSGDMLLFTKYGKAKVRNGNDYRKTQCDMFDQARQTFYLGR